MRHCFFLLVLAVAVVQSASAQTDVNDVVTQANAAYQSGDYDTAISLYESLVASGAHDGAIYYNLGTAYYQTGDQTRALLNYRRAQNWIPRDSDLNANMALIRAQRLDVQSEETGLIESLSVLTSSILTLTELGWIALGVWALWFLLLSVGILRKRWGDFLRPLLIVLAVVAVAGVTLLASRMYVNANAPGAVVVETIVTAMSGPGETYLELFQLHTAAELRLLETNGNWVRIALPDGRQGWLPRNSLELI
jgi:tetratricopeptide (TPR) repeat protein